MKTLTKVRYWILALRLAIGWLFLYAGISKLVHVGGWSAKGFLSHLEGPLAPLFATLAGNAIVDWLNVLGLTLIGLAFVLGLATRFAAFWGIVLMSLYYLAEFPPREDYLVLVDEHLIYAVVLLGFALFGAGELWGLDKRIEKTKFFRKHRWLKLILR